MTNTDWRDSPDSSRPSTIRRQYRACLDGSDPAEVLPTGARERLVTELHGRGWTDVEIAAHTSMTTYTAQRIRSRLELPVNFAHWEVA
jgi:hypothetical protein